MILANAFFVLGEFSLVAVDRSKIGHLAEKGDRRAESVRRGLTTLSFQLSGAQLGITMSSLVLGFIVEGTLAQAIRPLIEGAGLREGSTRVVSITIALALVTTIQMVAGELIPKNLAIARPLPSALWIASPLRLVNQLFRPVIRFLNGAANRTVELFGIEPQEELTSVRSLEELQLLIRSAREHGALPEEEASLLARTITFGDKTAAEALTPRTSVVLLRRDDTIADLQRVALETGHSRFPVQGENLDDIVGVVHVKDVYRIPPEKRATVPISEVMQEPFVVPESKELERLLFEMRREGKQLAVIADEYGGTAGIVTLEDLLEQIVGEIEDEYDPRGTGTIRPPEGVHLVDGMLHREELLELTGFAMPEGEHDTLAGFLLTLFDRIPEQGDHTQFDGWELKVVQMDRHRISKVLLVSPPSGAREEAE